MMKPIVKMPLSGDYSQEGAVRVEIKTVNGYCD